MRLALLSLPDFQKLALFCRTGVGIALVSDVHLSAGGLPLPDVPADFLAARVARPPWAMHVAGSRESCGRSDPALVVDLDENGGTGLPSAAAR